MGLRAGSTSVPLAMSWTNAGAEARPPTPSLMRSAGCSWATTVPERPPSGGDRRQRPVVVHPLPSEPLPFFRSRTTSSSALSLTMSGPMYMQSLQ